MPSARGSRLARIEICLYSILVCWSAFFIMINFFSSQIVGPPQRSSGLPTQESYFDEFEGGNGELESTVVEFVEIGSVEEDSISNENEEEKRSVVDNEANDDQNGKNMQTRKEKESANGASESVKEESVLGYQQVEDLSEKKSADTQRSPNGTRSFKSFGNWTAGKASELYVKLKLQYPDASEQLLRERAEFGALNLCSPYHLWYACIDNPSCVEKIECQHRATKQTLFKEGSYRAAFKFDQEKIERRKVLNGLLARMDSTVGRSRLRTDGFVFMMTLNAGFAFLFGNWLCSLQRYRIDVDYIRSKTMVLARDDDARKYVESFGFFTPSEAEMMIMTNWTLKQNLTKNAAPQFGFGDHKHLNFFFKFGLPLDLLELNMTVILQDVDFVWFNNPIPLMQRQCERQHCHGLFMTDGRPFVVHAYSSQRPWRSGRRPIEQFNTGLFMLVPEPQTVHFLRVLMHGLHLQQWLRRDQLYYNTVGFHKHFHDLRWRILPPDYFVPGIRLHKSELDENPLKKTFELVAIHVSDTGGYMAKIQRLRSLGHWYFTSSQCPAAVKQCHAIRTCWQSLKHCDDCDLGFHVKPIARNHTATMQQP